MQARPASGEDDGADAEWRAGVLEAWELLGVQPWAEGLWWLSWFAPQDGEAA